jgi:hypothetical protein
MPVGATVQVVGLKQTINGLGKIDKQLQKDFKSDATTDSATSNQRRQSIVHKSADK